MNPRRILRHLLAATATLAVAAAWPQQPFDLDPSFRTTIPARGVSSILPSTDGKVWISGFMWSAIAPYYNRLNHDGTGDMAAPYLLHAGFLRKWGDMHYCGVALVDRYFQDGTRDTSFNMNRSPAYHPLQGGDYHVLPDGGLLVSGVNRLYDSLPGPVGYFCLLRFTNDGSLDTTFQPRTCAGSLDFFTELPNGQFIGSLGNPPNTATWDGQTTGSNIIRFNADGSLDSTFQSNVWWGGAWGYLPLADGRVYVGGCFKIAGISDTLGLVRLMPDGSLDPTFNNTARYRMPDPGHPNYITYPGIGSIRQLSDSRLIVTGYFSNIDGVPRGGIALLDSTGQLLDELFSGNGCGGFYGDVGGYIRGITSMVDAPDGSFYIFGGYRGYDDGTTNDPNQWLVSRLYGLNVGISEHGASQMRQLEIAPNPSNGGAVQLTVGTAPKHALLCIHDPSGRIVRQEPWPAGMYTHTLRAGLLAPGTYMLRVQEEQGMSYTGKLIVLP